MLTGWTKPFKVDRLLETDERRAALPHQRQPGIRPDTFDSLIRFNSTYADFIDRKFPLRGMASTTFGIIGGSFLLLFGLVFIPYFIWVDSYLSGEIGIFFAVISTVVVAAFCFGVPWVLWKLHLRHDFFSYTHYPVRFNRKARKVHVFRHNGPGGVLTVPWDEVFWHVGRGYQQKFLCDVRGHVLDGDMVRETFAVGRYTGAERIDRIQSLWEFICRYMEEGPETAVDHPLDRMIVLSVAPTWKNCYAHAFGSMGAGFVSLRYMLAPLFYPIVWSLTLVRWLVFKTCKRPVWPPEVEEESRIEPDDPHRWEEPSFFGEFVDAARLERLLEHERQQQAKVRERRKF